MFGKNSWELSGFLKTVGSWGFLVISGDSWGFEGIIKDSRGFWRVIIMGILGILWSFPKILGFSRGFSGFSKKCTRFLRCRAKGERWENGVSPERSEKMWINLLFPILVTMMMNIKVVSIIGCNKWYHRWGISRTAIVLDDKDTYKHEYKVRRDQVD